MNKEWKGGSGDKKGKAEHLTLTKDLVSTVISLTKKTSQVLWKRILVSKCQVYALKHISSSTVYGQI